jgi:hypothetical protein
LKEPHLVNFSIGNLSPGNLTLLIPKAGLPAHPLITNANLGKIIPAYTMHSLHLQNNTAMSRIWQMTGKKYRWRAGALGHRKTDKNTKGAERETGEKINSNCGIDCRA